MKARYHFLFFILLFIMGILLFFSTELLLPSSIKKAVFQSPEIDKIGHFIGFFTLTWVITSILKISSSTTFFVLAFYGGLTELGQYYLGFRNGEFSDFIADLIGISVYIFIKWLYTFYKKSLFHMIKKSKRALN